jgi:predicted amidohydrolase
MKKKLLIILILLMIGYGIWSNIGRNFDAPTDANFRTFAVFGKNQNKGNMIGIQAYMAVGDYASEKAFYQKIEGFLEKTKQEGFLNDKSIVVFPEYLGTWLVAANEKKSVYQKAQLTDAMKLMIFSNILSYTKSYLTAPDIANKANHAIFAMKSSLMAEIYGNTFSKVAKKYGVTIVGGSILLPNPSVINGKIVVGDGELYNTTAVFRPDGTVEEKLTKKIFPTADETGFVCKAKLSEQPVYQTPAGKLAVLICADSWFSEAYKNIKKQGIDILAVPSFSSYQNGWDITWRGYSGFPTPQDAKNDIDKITEGEAWYKYAMAGRANKEGGVKAGINVFLKGKLWDMGFDGRTIAISDTNKYYSKRVNLSELSCLWL